MTTQEILKQYWGYDSFRPLQQDIIDNVLEEKDVLALLPTGGGKSICFQVPALAKDGICLVISPLIALMKDQVQNLKKKGIMALSIYSGMSFIETSKTLQNAIHGNFKFLYVSPERLQTKLFLEHLPAMNINLIAVDEAHCISQWGYDFRPSYLHIAELREYLPNVPIIALTASATADVQNDICKKLLFTSTHKRFQQSFERPNLSYSVFNVASKQNKLLEILHNVKGSAIVYCKSRKHTKEIADILQMNKISADYYHAGLSNDERNSKQEKWINNSIRVIACTNAFGMGIDKPDVRVVVHYDVPDCLENYYQEAGRAGRDGIKSYAVLLYTTREIHELQLQSNIRYASPEQIQKVYTALMNHLQIAAGSGENTSYEFDLITFCKNFKLNILDTTYAIKTLEQEEIVLFNEVFFKPSTLCFECSREDLRNFENEHPDWEPIIKGLLRSYEGIFDFPSIINEKQLAKFIGINEDLLITALHKMHALGIVSYMPQKEKPQLTLLQNRMYADNYQINLTDHLKRKAVFEKRIEAIINYTQNKITCRSTFIANYFNDPLVKKCGICDNCLHAQSTSLSKVEFEKIATHVQNLLLQNKLSLPELLLQSKIFKKDKVEKVIDFLLAEKKIDVNQDSKFTIQ